MLPYKDFTLKAKLSSIDRVKGILESIHAHFVGLDIQTDTYFETDKGKLKIRSGTVENLITHYERVMEGGLERTIVYQYDVNPTKIEIDLLIKERKKIGETKKERLIYRLDPCKVHVDRLGDEYFLEIEAIDRDNKFSNEELKALCWSLKDKLGIPTSDLLTTGYLKL